MKKNSNLHKAKTAKNDEFYTQLSDIENELKHYRQHFNGKVVYCNCDDSRESNFFKYFFLNFKSLGLKKLICTGYKSGGHGIKYETEVGDLDGNGKVDDGELNAVEMDGDGSYSSPECLALLEESDIVVTNPPFSLFRDYVKTLMDYGKKFLIIGNGNAVTYKEVFPLIKDNKIWLGAGKGIGGKMSFETPSSYVNNFTYDSDGKHMAQVNSSCWFTNLDHGKRHDELTLVEKYDPNVYPKYDNYDAIEVSKTVNIPKDYPGVIGVPITFLDKYNPDQFEIIGTSDNGAVDHKYYIGSGKHNEPYILGKKTYKRIFIRNKHPEEKKSTNPSDLMLEFLKGL